MGRRFDASQLKRMGEQTQVALEMWSPSTDSLPSQAKTYLELVDANSTNALIEALDDNQLHGYTHIDGLNSKPALILRATFPRPIAQQGRTALTIALSSTFGFTLLLILLLYYILQRQIGTPIKRLTDHLAKIRHNGELAPYRGKLPANEIGVLGEEFGVLINQLNEQLQERERLEKAQMETINQLVTSLAEIKTLRGIIPICASCKQIRDDEGAWSQVESYVRDHSDAEFSHGICPDCSEKLYGKRYE
jgi:methyl-accepting chemotaxis protein